MRLVLALSLLAAATIFGSIQMLPYPPEPTISGKISRDWEVIDRTHKGSRLPVAAHAASLRGSLAPVDANASPATHKAAPAGSGSYFYNGPHCSELADCNFKAI